MKSRISFGHASVFMGCGLCLSSFAGEFVNLGFDSPSSTALPYSELVVDLQSGNYTRWYGKAGSLLSGWQLSPDKVYYTDQAPPWGPVGPGVTLAPGLPGLGMHSLFIKANDYDPILQKEVYFQVGIAQSGQVPQEAARLRFYSKTGGNTFQLALNGATASAQPIAFDSPVYEVDVSPFAGQSLQMEFNFLERYYGTFDIYGFLDRNGNLITIPEPSTYALLGLGGVGMGWWVRRKRG